MSQEQNIGTPPAQQGKPAINKRGNRNGRNRPVLVTGDAIDSTSGAPAQADAINQVPTATTIPTMTEETPTVKSRPSFFSTIGIGKKEETVDAAAARLARANRNKAAVSSKKEVNEVRETKKPESKAVVKSAPTRSGRAAAPVRRGGFKPRHMIGILVYLIVADVVGVYEKSWLVSAHVEKLLFNLGPLPIYVSTVMFLSTLVILLVLLARFDLVPRSLSPAPRQPVNTNKGQGSTTDSENDRNTPSIKQGIKGADDDLYQEYRQTQRYWQRRDRKK